MASKSIESLKKLKSILDMYCQQSEAIIESYEKHKDQLNDLADLVEEGGDSKKAEKIRRLQNIDVKLAKKLICTFSPQ
jgi:hypothetical protein